MTAMPLFLTISASLRENKVVARGVRIIPENLCVIGNSFTRPNLNSLLPVQRLTSHWLKCHKYIRTFNVFTSSVTSESDTFSSNLDSKCCKFGSKSPKLGSECCKFSCNSGGSGEILDLLLESCGIWLDLVNFSAFAYTSWIFAQFLLPKFLPLNPTILHIISSIQHTIKFFKHIKII